MGFPQRVLGPVLFLSLTVNAQLPSSNCDLLPVALEDCPLTVASSIRFAHEGRSQIALASSLIVLTKDNPNPQSFSAMPHPVSREHFHWGRALFESFAFLSIEQAYVVKDDYRWVVVEKGVPFNHYWRDYRDSLSTWMHSGWDDGDPILYSYVGHPIQGALTEYIQIQNDPQGRNLEFSNTKAYWRSRFKAFWWSAAYSTQWNIGPLSELTVEKYGTVNLARRSWNHDGSYPCYGHCVTGVGQVDLVTTPVGGFLWQLTEDILDREIVRRVEGVTTNHFVTDFTRCALNPIRGGANILHGKAPWYRASRVGRRNYAPVCASGPPAARAKQ